MGFADAINIEDLRRTAKRRLPRVIFDFLDGGAEDEKTIAANRSAFDRYQFRPKMLTGVTADPSIGLFGKRLALPFMIAPTGMNGIHWVDGDLHLARAASEAGIGFSLSTASNNTIEEVAASCDGFRAFQLYPWGGPEIWAALLGRAKNAGYAAAFLTIDTLGGSNRERDRRNHFSHEVRYTPRVMLDGLLHPAWLVSTWFRRGAPRAENLAPFLPAGATAADLADFTRTARNPTFNWSDVERVRKQWAGPLVLKGVLRADDAVRAVDLGCDGVVVTNHGGRQLDHSVATFVALEEVADAIGGRATVLVDGGFRRGTDIVKALAVGADVVLLGRATLYGLASGGQAGAVKAIDILRDEFVRTMQSVGAATVGDLSRDYLIAAQKS